MEIWHLDTFFEVNIIWFINLHGIIAIIIKNITNHNGVVMPVILIDSQNEVLEFESLKEAEELQTLLQKNSDSGHEYVVKKI